MTLNYSDSPPRPPSMDYLQSRLHNQFHYVTMNNNNTRTMIYSGHNFISLPEVDTLSFNVPVSLNSIYGSGSFGFSGSGSNGEEQVIKFEFVSGEVRDFNGNYAASYFPNRNITVSGDIFSRGHHYYINNELSCLSGTQNYFRFKRFFYETSEEVSLESNASISIATPSLSFNSIANRKRACLSPSNIL